MANGFLLELLFEVIEHLAAPSHPLAYDFESSTLQTLVSFLTVCRATSKFTLPMLYSRVCIDSLVQLRLLLLSSPYNLHLIRSLYISINHRSLQEEAERIMGPSAYRKPSAEKESLFLDLHKEVADDLSKLLKEVRTGLDRLIIGCPESWGDRWDTWTGEEPPKSCGNELASIVPEIAGNLSELVLLRNSPPIALDSPGLCENMCRLCLFNNYFEVKHPTAPALDYLCLINPLSSMIMYHGALDKIHSVRKVLIFWGGPFMERFKELCRGYPLGAQSPRPIEVVTFGLPQAVDIGFDVGLMARSGRLWEMKDSS